jgi:hypothetical protein
MFSTSKASFVEVSSRKMLPRVEYWAYVASSCEAEGRLRPYGWQGRELCKEYGRH